MFSSILVHSFKSDQSYSSLLDFNLIKADFSIYALFNTRSEKKSTQILTVSVKTTNSHLQILDSDNFCMFNRFFNLHFDQVEK